MWPTEATFLRRYRLSVSLWTWLNPFGWAALLRHGWGETKALSRWDDGLPGPGSWIQQSRYRLPFDGWWTVLNGGVKEDTSHSWEVLNQRYAYDFAVCGRDGRTFDGSGERPGGYFAFGRPVLAAADGVVVAVRDGIGDHARPGTGWIDYRTRDFRGNHVVIAHAGGEHSFTAHLERGSVMVSVGEWVSEGQPIGRCGNSGHSTEPHVHFHVQDGPDFYSAVGLPVSFERYRVIADDRERRIGRGYLERGQCVRDDPTDAQDAALTVTR